MVDFHRSMFLIRQRSMLACDSAVMSLASLSSKGRRSMRDLFVGTADGRVRRCRCDHDGRLLPFTELQSSSSSLLQHQAGVTNLAIAALSSSSSSSIVVLSGADDQMLCASVCRFDDELDDWRVVKTTSIVAHAAAVRGLSIIQQPNSSSSTTMTNELLRCVTSSSDERLIVWRLIDDERQLRFERHCETTTHVAEVSTIATASITNRMHIAGLHHNQISKI